MSSSKQTRIFTAGILAVFGIVGLVIAAGMANAKPLEATIDSSEFVHRQESFAAGVLQVRTEVFVAIEDGQLYKRISDANGIISEVLALASDIAAYQAAKTASELAAVESAAETNLTGELSPGQKIQQWVENRSVELAVCEADATAGLGLGNWSTMSNGQQNAVITSLLTCQELNSRVNRKSIEKLLELLAVEGIIVLDP